MVEMSFTCRECKRKFLDEPTGASVSFNDKDGEQEFTFTLYCPRCHAEHQVDVKAEVDVWHILKSKEAQSGSNT